MNKTVIITGASRGIGRAAAVKFAGEGFNIVINSVSNTDKLNETEKLCLNANPSTQVLAVKGDISDSAFVKHLIDTSVNRFGSIDVLINNAGISFVGVIQDTDDETWQKIINTNLSSVHYFTRSVIPYMLKSGKGSIINISSVWGNVGASCEAAYAASKGGINAYTKSAAKELAPSGISVNAIACGLVDTDMNKCFSKEDLDVVCEEIPAGRPADPKEIAETIYHISQCPAYLTGQIITIDGGWT
ncbi:MAG: SDR family NAD(P)-dependent oxidoreductase [Lachnospiraceae bacterium]|nr:SDR family NAD(P)-dependent oxidoreductase [Lachnospiraceae bacterium]